MPHKVPRQQWWTWMCGSLVLVVLGLASTHAQAQEKLLQFGQGLTLGPIVLHPGLRTELLYDDNIFLRDDRRVYDLITKLSPLVNFELLPRAAMAARLRWRVDYTPTMYFFSRNGGEDFNSHIVHTNLLYDGSYGLRVALDEQYVITSEPSSSEQQSATGQARTPRRQNDLGLKVGYSVNPKVDLEFDALLTNHLFERDFNANLNRTEYTIGATSFYRFLPKTSALLAYSVKRTDFTELLPTEPDKDNVAHNVSLGLRFDPTAKVRGSLKVGYTTKVFDAATLSGEQAISTATQLLWAATQRTQVDLNVSRDIIESSTVGANSLTATRAELGLEQRLVIEALSASIRGSYERDDFHGIDRNDDIWRTSFTVRYAPLRWLSLSGGYEFGKKLSTFNDPVTHYRVNRFLFGITGQL